jgi:hypothetical protein
MAKTGTPALKMACTVGSIRFQWSRSAILR